MPIRSRIHTPKPPPPPAKIAHHKLYGSLENPPIRPGIGGDWPNGSMLVTGGHPRRRKNITLLGWSVLRRWYGYPGAEPNQYGVWICTKVGKVYTWKDWQLNKKLPKNPTDAINVQTDFKYVGEAYGFEEVMEMLNDAYMDHHEVSLFF